MLKTELMPEDEEMKKKRLRQIVTVMIAVLVALAGLIQVQNAFAADTPQGDEETSHETVDGEPKQIYTVIWLNSDETELDRKTYEEGEPEPTTEKIPAEVWMEYSVLVFEKWDSGTVNGTTKTYKPECKMFEKFSYYQVVPDNPVYVIGQANGVTLTVQVADADIWISHFTGKVNIDGKQAERGKDFHDSIGDRSSTVIKFPKEFLDTLDVGKHKIRIFFDEVESEITLTVKNDEPEKNKPVEEDDPFRIRPVVKEQQVGESQADTPKTADTAKIGVWALALAMAAIAAVAAAGVATKRREE